jgi:DNA-binding Lrp family transcriptional regulator
MSEYELDDVDKELLELLQESSRYPATELAERVGVSDNTVHNRIQRLEEAGVVTGYTTTLDLDELGLDLYFMFTCTARVSDRGDVAQEIRQLPPVLEVTELMTGQQNLLVKAVAVDDEDITHVAEQIDALNLEIDDENLIRAEHANPVDLAAIEAEFRPDS